MNTCCVCYIIREMTRTTSKQERRHNFNSIRIHKCAVLVPCHQCLFQNSLASILPASLESCHQRLSKHEAQQAGWSHPPSCCRYLCLYWSTQLVCYRSLTCSSMWQSVAQEKCVSWALSLPHLQSNKGYYYHYCLMQ